MQIARLFETVYLLLEKRTMTARDLADHFEVSIRTIYRDIDVLSQAGIPIYTSKGKGGGISLMDHYVLNKSLLTPKEQENILTSLSSMQLMHHDEEEKIIQKLGSIFQKNPIDWIEVDFHDWSLQEQQTKFDIIKAAIFEMRCLHFHYINLQGEKSERTLEPYKLIFKGQAWYVWGYCQERKAARFFKLSRMQQIQKTMTLFERRKMILNKTATAPHPMITVKLKVAKELAFRIFDECNTYTFEYKDNFLYVEAQLNNHDWIIGYLLSYGDHLEVLEPQSLRAKIHQQIQNMQKKYIR